MRKFFVVIFCLSYFSLFCQKDNSTNKINFPSWLNGNYRQIFKDTTTNKITNFYYLNFSFKSQKLELSYSEKTNYQEVKEIIKMTLDNQFFNLIDITEDGKNLKLKIKINQEISDNSYFVEFEFLDDILKELSTQNVTEEEAEESEKELEEMSQEIEEAKALLNMIMTMMGIKVKKAISKLMFAVKFEKVSEDIFLTFFVRLKFEVNGKYKEQKHKMKYTINVKNDFQADIRIDNPLIKF